MKHLLFFLVIGSVEVVVDTRYISEYSWCVIRWSLSVVQIWRCREVLIVGVFFIAIL
jgi:hypothetical protein